MAHILGILQSKGGAGKSTLAVSSASSLAAEGASVILVDTDKQETATKWAKQEVEGRGHIDHISELSDVEITELLRELRNQYDYVIVDTAGFDSRISGFITIESDLVLIPCKATVADAQGAISTNKYVSATANSIRRDIPSLGVRVDFDKGTNATASVNELLADYGKLEFVDTILWHATSFKDALNTGASPQGRAKKLTHDLITELRAKKLLPAPFKIKSAA
ncbi:AAA family ATPase [Pseudovibrio sp. Ad26]|uniref:AAA family ATPase n=1 Tax=Pseudovibrio sp. Ad26 TaxID=989410 RepID=UPI0007AE9667|nr:AAA family ATPase [Pseudovibrio sp. Ad26]KZK99131.1 VirC1 protein [Pseudovibrio sp. Ad26]